MDDCVFCKIAKKNCDCFCIYEDKFTKAFLDIHPWTEGHTLVIPKKHYNSIFDIPQKELNKVMAVVKKLSIVYRKIFDNCDINIINSNGVNAQQDIPHFHVHIIPRHALDGQKIKLKINRHLQKDIQSTFNKIKSTL